MEDKLMTPKEVAEMLHLSRSYLVRLERSGKLPAIRVGNTDKTGGHRRWKMSDVKRYMENGSL